MIFPKSEDGAVKKNRLLLSAGFFVILFAVFGLFSWDFIQGKMYEYKVKQALANNDRIFRDEKPEVKVGEVAPDFQLETLNGEPFQLSDHRGKVILLNFWATWCPPCQYEMPHLQNFYEKNEKRPFVVVAVNLTSQDQGLLAIEEFVKDFGLTFLVPLDYYGEVGILYSAYAIPTNYIIDQDGVVVHKHPGPVDENMLNEWIDPLLADD